MIRRNIAALGVLSLVAGASLSSAAFADTERATGVPVPVNGQTVQVVTVDEFNAAVTDLQGQIDALTGETPVEPTEPAPEPAVVPVPTGLTATPHPDRRVALNWSDVEGTQVEYVIYERRTTGPVTVVTASARTSSPLSPGDYFYAVAARVNGVEGERTAEVRVTVIAESAATPTPPAEPEPEPEAPLAQPTRAWTYDGKQPGDSLIPPWSEIHALRSDQWGFTADNPYPGSPITPFFTVKRGDTGWGGTSGTLRSEVRNTIAESGSIAEGTEQFWAWSTFFPADFDWDERNQFFGFAQWHQRANSGNPQVHVWSDVNENLMVDVRGGTGGTSNGDAQFTRTFNLGPLAKGAWNDLTFRFIWSSDPSKGLIEVWHQGRKVLSERVANKYVKQSAYFKYGIYSAAGTYKVHRIQEAPVAFGPTLDSVRAFNRLHPIN